MKKITSFFLCFLLVFGLGFFWHQATAGFRLHKISFDLPLEEKWATTKKMEDQILSILNQDFYYLNKGRQTFVFESSDHQYVIKFFRYHLVKPRLWLHFPWGLKGAEAYRQRRIKNKRGQFEQWMDSYTLAYKHLQKTSGLVYIHLVKTDIFHKNLRVFDNLKRGYFIDLDTTGFLIQKKATLFSKKVKELIEKKEISSLKRLLHAYLLVLADRNHKGIKNKDHSWLKNYGCIGLDEVYEIDSGRYSFVPPASTKEALFSHLLSYTTHFRNYLVETCPEIIPFFEKEADRVAQATFQEGLLCDTF